jgi:hypothetical protein
MSPSFPTSKQLNSSAYRHSAAKGRKDSGRQKKKDSGGGCGWGPGADDGKAGEDKDDDDDGRQADSTINRQ